MALTFPSVKSLPGVEWELRDVIITSSSGKTVFEQRGVEVPTFWSDVALNVAVHKYFFGNLGTKERETSIAQLIGRVASTIVNWGFEQGHLIGEAHAQEFYLQLIHILTFQEAAFNSPVWFNVGTTESPQCSACFITSVDDTLESIEDLYKVEMEIFRRGSGDGVNLSRLRGSCETLSKGGQASGPIPFMKGLDFSCGAMRSGGRARRGALMRILDIDHPDIVEFIGLKLHSERMAHSLIEAGFDKDWDTGIYKDIPWQNANNSVRVTDAFMQAVIEDKKWDLIARTTGVPVATHDAKTLMRQLAEAAWTNGCPGIQYHDTTNRWHTCAADGPIRASNPCIVGDTFVDTDRGKIKIRDIAQMEIQGEELPIAFCWDTELHCAAAGRIQRAWKTRENAQIIKITTDKGLTLRCTPDHLILVRDHARSSNERYVAAQDLKIGSTLRVWPRGKVNESEGHIFINDRFSSFYEHRLVWEAANGPIPEGYDVHHKDECKTNNCLSNLELVHETIHARGHKLGDKNAMYGKKRFGEKALIEGSHNRWKVCQERSLELLKLLGEVTPEVYDDQVKVRRSALDQFNSSKRLIKNFGTWQKVLEEALQPNHKVIAIQFDGFEDVYDLTVERYHNFVVSDREEIGVRDGIVIHNCSEYVFLDNTSCNLASINLCKFLNPDGTFDFEGYEKTIRIMITAMDIVIDKAHYPNEQIAKQTKLYRTLGLGYANLGALLMRKGLPYDSETGRYFAAVLTATLQAVSYDQSANLGNDLGPFKRFAPNYEHVRTVLVQHAQAVKELAEQGVSKQFDPYINHQLTKCFELLVRCQDQTIRNAQVTVLAPTGTIGLLMDCDTTGVEPDMALIKYKQIHGTAGSMQVLVNSSVRPALKYLRYSESEIERIEAFIAEHNTVVGSDVNVEHHSVFDTALGKGRTIHWEGHIKMMAAVQPFLSGAISKTINMPSETTPQEIEQAYILGWRLGLKALAIYRDGSKGSQPVNVTKESGSNKAPVIDTYKPYRLHLPECCSGKRIKFDIGGIEIYVHTGEYGNGDIGELFITASKSGSTLQGLLNCLAISISTGLQFGVPLEQFIKMFRHQKFEPSGLTKIPAAERASFYGSIPDVIAHWLELTYIHREQTTTVLDVGTSFDGAPPCQVCGTLMNRSGTCFKCPQCGSTSGCS